MFERPRGGERCILVALDDRSGNYPADRAEFVDLARSAGAEIIEVFDGPLSRIQPRLFIGTGKAAILEARVRETGAELVIFNHPLSPSQERNLERLLQARVLDRTGLILDIFARRAQTFEGKLQVELAQLTHLATRLVRGWTHLERQKGGIGLRGPGETQLETDRRLLGDRIKSLKVRLDKVVRQRETGRNTRRRAEVPTVALVGYTNAGKSTLFNALTGSEVHAADQLFATLDPTVRKLDLGSGERAVVADTVGFVRDLPHDLVAAFRSTLQETREADLLVKVVDAADPQRGERLAQVDAVLQEAGAGEVPVLEVWNKLDLLDAEPRIERDEAGLPRRVWVSARDGVGMDLLREAIHERLGSERVAGWFRIPPMDARVRARLFELGAVRDERNEDDGGWLVEIDLPRREFDRLGGLRTYPL
ncbi:MAG: GTPase HflX [Xanthomonadaceae bacterium]|nr:GTPase HflX [Xanthomonadaceae bacterium]